MNRIFAILLTLAVCVVTAIGPAQAQRIRLDGVFDPQLLTRDELRIVQAALVTKGTYTSLIDGAWGRGSQSALDAHVRATSGASRATWRDIRALARGWAAYDAELDWTSVWLPEARLSYQRPAAILTESPSAAGTTFRSTDRNLLLSETRTFERPATIHDNVLAQGRASGGTAPYQSMRENRMITAVETPQPSNLYARSDRTTDGWVSHVLLHVGDDPARRVQVIASSFSKRREADLSIPPSGVLASLVQSGAGRPTPNPVEAPDQDRPPQSLEEALVGALASILRERLGADDTSSQPTPQATPTQPAPVRARNSGVFVNTTDIVTTARLAALCGDVELSDGTRATLIALDDGRDVAVFSVPGRSVNWVALDLAGAERSEPLLAVSRRVRGNALSNTQLRVIRDLPGEGVMLVDRPSDDPLSGGSAILTRYGALTAIWPSGAARERYAEATSARWLAGFLTENNIPFATASSPEAGIPERTREAAVALRCAQ